jgi:DNA-directed RNA polymerase subunit M/transcription elongation factor TFIIS
VGWFKNKDSKKYKARVITAREMRKLERRERRRQERIPKDIKRMVDANCARTTVCYKCGGVSERRIELLPDKNNVIVYYDCRKCGWSERTKTMLYPRKVREMVSSASSISMKTWRGVRFICPKCRSERVKLIIQPEYIKEDLVTVNYKCASCGWGALFTLSIVKR